MSSSPVSPISGDFQDVLSKKLMEDGLAHYLTSVPRSLQSSGELPTHRKALTAGDIMTSEVYWIDARDTMAHARDLMVRRNVRHLPVLGTKGVLVGILSDRDVLSMRGAGDVTVLTRMSAGVKTIEIDTTVRQLASEFLANRIHALPVTDASKHLLGIVTTTDILRAIVEKAPIDLWA